MRVRCMTINQSKWSMHTFFRDATYMQRLTHGVRWLNEGALKDKLRDATRQAQLRNTNMDYLVTHPLLGGCALDSASSNQDCETITCKYGLRLLIGYLGYHNLKYPKQCDAACTSAAHCFDSSGAKGIFTQLCILLGICFLPPRVDSM